MTKTVPQFLSLTPTVLSPDRVLLDLKTTNLPGGSNVFLNFDWEGEKTEAAKQTDHPLEDPEAVIRDSPYPNVELSILDDEHHEVAQMIIVEHKEEHISMTMHIRHLHPGKTYIARADMVHNRQLIQTLSTPFKLQRSDAEVEQ